MRVEEVMTRNVGTCRPLDSLGEAAQIMWDHDCGCVPVVSEDGSGRVVGMLTDRDICMATHLRGLAPGRLRVGEVMSTAVRTIGPGEEAADAEAVMRDAQVRRLPVVDAGQRLLGLISLADILRAAARAGRRGCAERDAMEEELVETLEVICEAREPLQPTGSGWGA